MGHHWGQHGWGHGHHHHDYDHHHHHGHHDDPYRARGAPPASIECPECRAANPLDAKFCVECGTSVRPVAAVCGACGVTLPSGAKFCPECGTTA